jgi:hypothetical protein
LLPHRGWFNLPKIQPKIKSRTIAVAFFVPGKNLYENQDQIFILYKGRINALTTLTFQFFWGAFQIKPNIPHSAEGIAHSAQ